MASIVWNREPQEAVRNPYEYNAQKQYHREAITLSDKLSDRLLNKKRFLLNEVSLEKAIWMLQTDALFAFRDAVELLEQKRHRIVGRLLRDILENVHLVEYFNSMSEKSKVDLKNWYNDSLVMHREYRDLIKQNHGPLEANLKRDIHRNLSKFTHRSYKVLLYGYALGAENQIFYDEGWSLPQSISMYYAYLGHFGRLLIENLKNFGLLEKDEVEEIWNNSMEPEQIPRGYLSRDDEEFLGIFDD